MTVTGRVVEVTSNVTGQIVAIPVKPNVPVKANDVLFQIDPAPFQYKVAQLQASLAGAKQQVEILKSNYERATANVAGLTAQAAYNKMRLADIETLAADMANTEFQAQDKQVQYETVCFRRALCSFVVSFFTIQTGGQLRMLGEASVRSPRGA